MRGLNLDQLEAFAAVAELGSFSAAAARLNLTQPAISFQIRQLERRLGARLVERVGRRAQPTAAGRELLPHIGRIETSVASAVEAMADHAQGVAGRVRIGTGATACIYLLPPVLSDLRRRFPLLELVVRTGNSLDMLRALEDNALDVALVTLPAPGRMFDVEKLIDDEIVAVFPPDPAPPGKLSPAALAELPVMLSEPGSTSRRVIDDWFRLAGVALKPVMELGSMEAIKQLVAAGLGCGLMPRLAMGEGGSLAAHSLAPPLHREIGLVVRRDKVPDRGLRELMRSLGELKSAGQSGSTSKTAPSRASRSSSSRLTGTV
ncbi:MAG TPA: LysR family transcriptional regulator [Stellaceae bacterium]|nr:LysR family transcriptional regulator [Stellaceae bacterium]